MKLSNTLTPRRRLEDARAARHTEQSSRTGFNQRRYMIDSASSTAAVVQSGSTADLTHEDQRGVRPLRNAPPETANGANRPNTSRVCVCVCVDRRPSSPRCSPCAARACARGRPASTSLCGHSAAARRLTTTTTTTTNASAAGLLGRLPSLFLLPHRSLAPSVPPLPLPAIH